MIPGAESTTGDWITLTDDQQGGTTPAPEALASSQTQASQQTAAATAVADEPAAPADPETTADAPEASAPEPATAEI